MDSSKSDIALFRAIARQNASIKWYAIADSAQHKAVPNALLQRDNKVQCLFRATQESPLAKHAPHLVEMNSPLSGNAAWRWVSRNASSSPGVSIIGTSLTFESLLGQLKELTDIILPDGEEMFFAFWDPAILGTLVGQIDDLTLHVAGPVLSSPQQQVLFNEIDGWWYWDRDRNVHATNTAVKSNVKSNGKFCFDQQQVDDLVEASVPDHVLYYLELNQPLLLEPIHKRDRYQMVRECLAVGRDFGLVGMGDLVNFSSLRLIYGVKFYEDTAIAGILERVGRGEWSLTEAMPKMP